MAYPTYPSCSSVGTALEQCNAIATFHSSLSTFLSTYLVSVNSAKDLAVASANNASASAASANTSAIDANNAKDQANISAEESANNANITQTLRDQTQAIKDSIVVATGTLVMQSNIATAGQTVFDVSSNSLSACFALGVKIGATRTSDTQITLNSFTPQEGDNIEFLITI